LCPKRAFGQEVVLYTGDLKLEKGADWIVESLPALLRYFPEVFFTVHWSSNRFNHPVLEALGNRLQQLAASHSRLRLLEGPLSRHEWQVCLRDSSCFVLPYDPAAYAMRTSGIFWERVFWNRRPRSMIVTADSWMAREATELGVDVGVCRFADTESLIAAITQSLTTAMSESDASSEMPACFALGNDEFLWRQWREINP
jgi:glycosyltransferase involved in cell wall biosynthesis